VLLFSDSQYESREEWNPRNDERYWVPQPFDPDAAVEWIAGRDLVTGKPVFAPAACCLMWYPFSPEEAEFARADTIGCASGSTFSAALAGALLEIIERDSLAIWWYSRARRPGMVLESFEHGPLLLLAEQLRRMGRKLHLLDITTDLGIPTYAAVAPRHDGTEPVFAAAAHPSPAVAAWKAASEASQIITYVLHKRSADAELVSWIRQATTLSQPYLTPFERKEAPPEPPEMDAGEQCVWCVLKLKDLGLRPVEINLTRKDVSLHTVRALVPGLRHIWNRRAPGRLYEVPLRLGWIEERLEEDGLNSICCMI
jgi:ribosomal protein S12 methylthiotransferase accessory factor